MILQTKNGVKNTNTHSSGQGNFPLSVDSSNPFGNSGALYGEKKKIQILAVSPEQKKVGVAI